MSVMELSCNGPRLLLMTQNRDGKTALEVAHDAGNRPVAEMLAAQMSAAQRPGESMLHMVCFVTALAV